MTILDRILDEKRLEVEKLKQTNQKFNADHQPISLFDSFNQSERMNIIAEFKRASPSKGPINLDADVAQQTKMYEQYGAGAISVLTDEPFFQGSMDDLLAVRKAVNIPILNKDFILDEIQIDRAKNYGADVILLIAAALEPSRLGELYRYATDLGLEVLLEIHDTDEMNLANDLHANIIGINNRDLKTFEVDVNVTERLSENIQRPDALLISESGMKTREDVERVQKAGARGILVGETMMQSEHLEHTFDQLRIPLTRVLFK